MISILRKSIGKPLPYRLRRLAAVVFVPLTLSACIIPHKPDVAEASVLKPVVVVPTKAAEKPVVTPTPPVVTPTTVPPPEIKPPTSPRVGAAKAVDLGSGIIERHVWQALNQPPQSHWQGKEFGVYTYVLFNAGLNTNTSSYDERQAQARLSRVLLQIAREEDHVIGLSDIPNIQQSTNLFLIPSQSSSTQSLALKDYSVNLSRAYLSYFTKFLQNNQNLRQRLENKGPFLIATRKPISEIVQVSPDGKQLIVQGEQPVLLVDMSKAHEKSVDEIVRTFRNHLQSAGLVEAEAFEPMRLKLVSLLLKLNDAITVVNTAVASSCAMVGAESACGSAPKKDTK